VVGLAGKLGGEFPPVIYQNVGADAGELGIFEQNVIGRFNDPPFIGGDVGRRKIFGELERLEQLRLGEAEIVPDAEELGMQVSLAPPPSYAHPCPFLDTMQISA
jgi:hypothetical protein